MTKCLWGLFFILVLVGSAGCSKHADAPVLAPVKQDFGSIVPDQILELTKTTPLHSVALPAQVAIDSSDWFELSNSLLDAGEKLGEAGDKLLAMGHALSQAFYQQSFSSTKMTGTINPPGSPWSEAAYFYAKPLMKKKMDEVITKVEAKVALAADRTSVPLTDLGAHPLPEAVIQRVVDGLQEFKTGLTMQRDGTGDAFIDKITDALENKYIHDLEVLKGNVSLGGQVPLAISLERLEKSLSQLNEVSELERERLLSEVRLAIALAKKNREVVDSSGALHFLTELWLSHDTQKNFPAPLKKVFENLSDAQILTLVTLNQGTIFSPADFQALKLRSDFNFMSDKELVALYLQNNGRLVADEDWQRLKSVQLPTFEALLPTPQISHFSDVVAGKLDAGPDNERFSLVSNWIGVAQRLAVPDELKGVFEKLNNAEVGLVGDHWATTLALRGHVELPVIRYKIMDGLEKFGAKPNINMTPDMGINNFKSLFESAIINGTREKVNHSVIPIAQALTTQLKESLIPILEEQRKEEGNLANAAFKNYGRYYLGKLVFGVSNLNLSEIESESSDNRLIGQYPLPLIEKARVHFTFSRGRWMESQENEESGSAVLGLSLVNTEKRLLTLSKYEGVPLDARGAVDLQFQSISKLLAIGGYRNFNNDLSSSFSVAMTSGHQSDRLNLRDYNVNTAVFAVPDHFKTAMEFHLDESSRQNPEVSVDGQMTLLHGLDHMIKYLKPWQGSTFDVGLGSLRIGEDLTLRAFDRGDYFLLSVGLASMILKNIPQKMLGLITDSGDYVDVTKKPSEVSNIAAASAVLTDYTRDKHSTQVRTASLAKAIWAMAEFYEQIKDLERTDDPSILPHIDHGQLQDSRNDLQKLISGMLVFATTKLMGADGGFDHSFELKTMKADGQRVLADQLLMERALIAASHVFESGFMIARATDNFFFLNAHMWSAELGFYRDSNSNSAKLVDVSRALENASDILGFLNHFVTQSSNSLAVRASIVQVEALQKLWTERFFSPEISHLPAVQQLFQFSL